MALKPASRRPVGRQPATPRRRDKAPRTPALALPDERDESVNATAPEPGPGGQAPALPPQTLAEQKADFTAEGSPPPGKVGAAPPARAPDPHPRKR